jgi:hypothetical protein
MSHAFSHGGFTHAGGETPNQLLTFQLGSPSEADPFFSWEVHQKLIPFSVGKSIRKPIPFQKGAPPV